MNAKLTKRALIIGIGNADRGDDGIGLEVVRKVRHLCGNQFEFAESTGDPTHLMDLWKDREQVEIVDACMTRGRQTGEWLTIEANDDDIAGITLPTSTHALGLREALELGKIFGNMPPSLRLWLICAEDFSPLQPVRPAVRRAGDQVAAEIARMSAKTP